MASHLIRCGCLRARSPSKDAAGPSRCISKVRLRGLRLDESAAPARRVLDEYAAPAAREYAAPARRVLDEFAAPAMRVLDARSVACFVSTGRAGELDADALTLRVVDARHRVSTSPRSIAKVVHRHSRDDGKNLLQGRHQAAHEHEGKATAARPSTSHPTRGSARPRVGEEGGIP